MDAEVRAYRVRLSADGSLLGAPLGVRLRVAGQDVETRAPGVTDEEWAEGRWVKASEAAFGDQA